MNLGFADQFRSNCSFFSPKLKSLFPRQPPSNQINNAGTPLNNLKLFPVMIFYHAKTFFLSSKPSSITYETHFFIYVCFCSQPSWMKNKEYWDRSFEDRWRTQTQNKDLNKKLPLKVSNQHLENWHGKTPHRFSNRENKITLTGKPLRQAKNIMCNSCSVFDCLLKRMTPIPLLDAQLRFRKQSTSWRVCCTIYRFLKVRTLYKFGMRRRTLHHWIFSTVFLSPIS